MFAPVAAAENPRPRGGHDALLPVLWRQRQIVGGSALACLVLAIIYLFCATSIYTSTARMSVRLAVSRLGAGEAMAITDSSAGNYLYTEQEKILSPAVLDLAAQMPEVKPYLQREPNKLDFLENGLTVDVGKRDSVISINFSSPDRVAAARIANAIVKAYMAYQITPKAADTAELDRLAEERKKLDEEIAAKTAQMLALEKKYGVLAAANDRDSLAERRLGALSQDLHAAHLETLKAESEYNDAQALVEQIRRSGFDTDAVTADGLGIGADQEALIRTELLQIQARLQDVRAQYGPDHPYIQGLKRRLREVQIIYARAIERRYRVTKQREQDLRAELQQQQEQAVEISARAAQYVRLQADIENDRKRQSRNEDRRRDIETARDLGTLNIDPFDPAQPELKPSHPRKRTTLSLALLLGLVLGGGLGYLRDWIDDRFRNADEMKQAMGLPLLGSVPQMPDEMPLPAAGQQALLEPMSEVAEACRTIRTSIYFGAPKDRSRTILITSAASGDGKSTLASNLAITMAQAGKRVLLMDADLRLPNQHNIFGLHTGSGLSSLLVGQATLDQAVQATPVNGLEVLPCGPRPQNPSEMLNSSMFQELLEVLADRFDHVIIDAPPAMGVADARIIGASCDQTILVLRAHKSTRRLCEAARDGLTNVGAHMLGIVINALEAKTGSAYATYIYGRNSLGAMVKSIHLRVAAQKAR